MSLHRRTRFGRAIAGAAVAIVGAALLPLSAASASPMASSARATSAVPAAAPAADGNSEPGTFRAVMPARILDTRVGNGAPARAVGPGATLVLQVTGRGGVPTSGVGGVTLNVTVADGTSTGHITAYPVGSSRPTASALNYVAHRSVANLVVVRLGTGGAIALTNASTGSVQLVADVQGYYRAGAATVAGAFTPLTPSRLLDTRSGNGAPQRAVAAHGTLALKVLGRGGVPSTGVGTVTLNVTATGGTRSGYVTAYAAGSRRPGSSNLNYVVHQTIPGLVVVQVGSGGVVDLYNGSAGTVELIADVEGYTRSGTATTQGSYVAYSPYRVMDTRTGLGGKHSAFGSGSSFTLNLGASGYQVDTAAVVVTVTATGERTGGWLRLSPGSGRAVTSSNLNYVAGQSIANVVVVPLNAAQTLTVTASNTDVVIDVNGYLRNPTVKWGTPTVTDPVRSPFAHISCPTATFCIAFDSSSQYSTFDGSHWSTPTALPQSIQPQTAYAGSSVSCPTSTWCMEADTWGESAYWNGTTWTVVTPPVSGHTYGAVSCPAVAQCVAMDSGAAVSFTGGSAWSTAVPVRSEDFLAVSCPTMTFCAGVPDHGDALAFNPTTGVISTSIDASYTRAVSCASPTFCVAATDGVHAEMYNGTSWSATTTLDPNGDLQAISCPSATFCAAVDLNGNAVTWNGSAWSTPQPASGQYSSGTRIRFMAVACASSAFCAASDWSGNVVTYDGSTWSAATSVEPNHRVTGLSCGAPTLCVAVDQAGAAVIYNGTSWAAPSPVTSGDGLSAVSCVGTTFCLATSGGNAYTYDGATWHGPTAVTTDGFSAVSCISSTWCLATTSTAAYIYNGSSWSSPTDLTIVNQILTSVACASSAFCVAAQPFGGLRTFNGSSWSGSNGLADNATRVSCLTTQLCVAAGFAGSLYDFDGHGWSAESSVNDGLFTGTTCASTTFCAAMLYNGVLYSFNGVTWGLDFDQVSLGEQQTGSLVSCPTTAMCVEMGQDGGVASVGRA